MLSLFALAAASGLIPQLQPMAALTGHCWQAELPGGEQDVHCFEPFYDGRFIRDRHEVTGGKAVYQGETIYGWDAAAGKVAYTYWSNDGAISTGGMRPAGDLLDFGEDVSRGPDGKETRIATTWVLGKGSYDARWASADPRFNRTMHYVRAETAPVRAWTEPAPGGGTNLIHEAIVPALPADIYAAVSSAEGWRSWAVPHAWADRADPDLMETSYAPAAKAGDPANIRQLFLARVPDRLVVFRTIHAPPGFPTPELLYKVTQVLELTPVPGGTRVRLTGLGYPAGEAGQKLVAMFRAGNAQVMQSLRRRFAP